MRFILCFLFFAFCFLFLLLDFRLFSVLGDYSACSDCSGEYESNVSKTWVSPNEIFLLRELPRKIYMHISCHCHIFSFARPYYTVITIMIICSSHSNEVVIH